MALIVISRAFGAFPIGNNSKRHTLLALYSAALFLAYFVGYCRYLQLRPYELKLIHWFKLVLDHSSTFLRCCIWFVQLSSAFTNDTNALRFVVNRAPVHTLAGLLICTGLPVMGAWKYIEISHVLTVYKSAVAGVTRSVQHLILSQFVVGVDGIGRYLQNNAKANVFESIAIHNDCIRKAKQLNDFYQAQLLLCTASIFLTLSSESYYMLTRFDFVGYDNILGFLEDVGWFLFALYWLLKLVKACESFYNKIETFNDELYFACKIDPNMRANDQIRLYAISKPTMAFTASRLFNIGYPLITSVISSAATYLAILVELSSD